MLSNRCQGLWNSPSCRSHRRRLCISPRYFQTSRMGFRYAYLRFSNVRALLPSIEPQRMTFQPHENGIFDVKWSLDDSMLATASGDKSTRISSVETQNQLQLLQTHTSSVKCIAWDPSHRDILSTGSRDGKICVWDLRMASSRAGVGEGIPVLQPVIVVHDAHGQGKSTSGRRKITPLPRSVTSILYTGTRSHTLISSGSFDGYVITTYKDSVCL